MIRLFRPIRAYYEIIRSGEIHSLTVGDKICLDFRGNLCGDILVFISPGQNLAAGEDILSILSSDKSLQFQADIATKSFRQKLNGITLFPVFLAGILNGIFVLGYLSGRYEYICRMCSERDYYSLLTSLLYLIVPVAITLALRKSIGFSLIRFFIFIAKAFSRPIRKMRKQKVI